MAPPLPTSYAPPDPNLHRPETGAPSWRCHPPRIHRFFEAATPSPRRGSSACLDFGAACHGFGPTGKPSQQRKLRWCDLAVERAGIEGQHWTAGGGEKKQWRSVLPPSQRLQRPPSLSRCAVMVAGGRRWIRAPLPASPPGPPAAPGSGALATAPGCAGLLAPTAAKRMCVSS